MKLSKLAKLSLIATLSFALAIPTLTTASAAFKWDTATSASQGGGITALAAACKKEGQLNVIALPRDWANYGLLLDGFKTLYGVKIDEANPGAGSEDEITAAVTNKGTMRSPDVFDIGTATADKYAGKDTFAPYKVKTWNYIQGASTGSPTGEFTPAYGGTLTIGYNGDLGTITSLDDLFDAKFKGKVALNGDPLVSSTALNGVFFINKALGGTFTDVSKGVAYFKKLKSLGNFINVKPSQTTIAAGQTQVIIDNLYNALAVKIAFAKLGKTWKTYTPTGLANTYTQAISLWAPHPACARLWLEYVLSETGARAWADGGATPSLWVWMIKTNRAHATGIETIGRSKISAPRVNADQQIAARVYLKTAWPDAVGTS